MTAPIAAFWLDGDWDFVVTDLGHNIRNGAGTSTSLSITLTDGAAVDTHVIVMGAGNVTTTAPTVTDSKGNTWQNDLTLTSVSAAPVIASSKISVELVAGDTITITWAAGQSRIWAQANKVAGAKGLEPSGWFDISANAQDTSATQDVTINIGRDKEVIFAFTRVGGVTDANPIVTAYGDGWNQIDQERNNWSPSTGATHASEWIYAPTDASYTAAFTISNAALSGRTFAAAYKVSTTVSATVTFPSVASGGVGTLSQSGLRIELPARTSSGVATLSQSGLRITLPARTSSGVGTLSQSGLKIQLPARSSAGIATLSQTGLKTVLPSRTTSGVGTLTQSGLKKQLPSRSSSGVATLTQSGLRIQLPSRSSAGVGTLSQTGLRKQLPSRSSAGVGTLTQAGLRKQLPSRTSSGVGTLSQAGLRKALPSRTAAGVGSGTVSNLSQGAVNLPARTTAGVGTLSQSGLRIRTTISSSGVGSLNQTGLKERLPTVNSAGQTTIINSGLLDIIAFAFVGGTSTATASGLRTVLPQISSSGVASTTLSLVKVLKPVTSSGKGALVVFGTRGNIVVTFGGVNSPGKATVFADTIGRLTLESVYVFGVGRLQAFSSFYITAPKGVIELKTMSTVHVNLVDERTFGEGVKPSQEAIMEIMNE